MININYIYELLNRVYVNKNQSGWIRPTDFNLNAYNTSIYIFNHYKKSYEIDKTSQDALQPFVVTRMIPSINGVVTLPNNTERIISFRYNKNEVTSTETVETSATEVECSDVTSSLEYVSNIGEEIDEETINIDGCLMNNILPSTGNNIASYENAVGKGSYGISRNPCLGGFPRYETWGKKSNGEKLYRISPNTIQTVFVKYLRTPKEPKWGYILQNGKPVYDATTSVDFEFDEQFIPNVIIHMASLFGVTIRDNELLSEINQIKQ